MGNTPYGHAKSVARTIIEDTLVVGKVLELVIQDSPRCGLYLNVDKAEVFLPKEDLRRRLASIFLPNIGWPLHDVKLLVAKINDPQCVLLLLRACTSISKLYFAMPRCPACAFKSAQRSFDVALRCTLERWYLNDRTIIEDTLVVGKVLELVIQDSPRCGLYLNVDKAEVFLPKEDLRRRLASIFLPNIGWPLHDVKLLGDLASVDLISVVRLR
uniref:Uncharacterized protein n=1 Tax=Tanacetum cinerariifolium TaxID=118510 RepID=A0A6L2KYN8_TANCI|nr:hypothetical protein [Tanacetum cinerariifolium]